VCRRHVGGQPATFKAQTTSIMEVLVVGQLRRESNGQVLGKLSPCKTGWVRRRRRRRRYGIMTTCF